MSKRQGRSRWEQSWQMYLSRSVAGQEMIVATFAPPTSVDRNSLTSLDSGFPIIEEPREPSLKKLMLLLWLNGLLTLKISKSSPVPASCRDGLEPNTLGAGHAIGVTSRHG